MGSENAFVSTAFQITPSGVAEGAVTRYRGVQLGTANQQVIMGGAGVQVFGVAQETAADTVEVPVCILGPSYAIAGAAIAKGARVKMDANGKFVTAVADEEVAGSANSAAAADGDRFSLMVNPGILAG